MTMIKEDLYQEAVENFLHLCHIRTYPAKAIIIRPGDVGDKLIFIVEGSVAVSVEDENGRELILAYLNKSDFIGEMGVFKAPVARTVSVKTRCQCQLAEISYDRFLQALKKELKEYATDLLCLLGKQLATRLLNTSGKYRDLAFMDVEGRVARTLLDLCQEPDAMTHPDGMQLSITRQEIGRIVGCSREMSGRVLKELNDKGLISAHGKTIVVFGTR
ncbi:MAG TPA: cAMP-activated global transcriptional regulator CRP [Methylococcaceae bacterium]|nr:cAMP-activated global transcriptional regulator CRP [Methylococcaceae bacterium]